ncbi:O-antigen ligase family protein [Erythrobacter crassostreae]|uniref:O-antigen ligase family protein n=1 Tax=Erythrobacter crassostreae TaxID=2828328 RepID=A0A9X1JJT9_9SPHN|nr:O-antigen ligase family protein [Erythrobacter crassostrea]MBV7258295.1 O-antigen ligase family protein [Erythrobacter crassostrea]
MTNSALSKQSALIAIAAIICIAAVMGGGGVRYGIANLTVQLTALAFAAFHCPAIFAFWKTAPASLRVLIALSALLPLAQLIPLPESVWTSLPGRELVQQSFALTGHSGWVPLSVDPIRTTVALTGIIVPLAILMVGWSLKRRQLLMLGWLIVAIGLVNVLIGIPQVLAGVSALPIYPEPGPDDVLYGLFANRNSTGLFLVAAFTLAAILPSPKKHAAVLPVRLALCLLFLVAIVLTRSRTALVLAMIPIAMAMLRSVLVFRSSTNGQTRKSPSVRFVTFGAIALCIAAAATTLSMAPGRVADTMERFQAQSDARAYIWKDATYSASRYWPAGTGMGTFDEVFQTDESLENVTERRAGRAHNDYLEVAIEAGATGIILIAAWLIMIAWLAWRARNSERRWAAWAGGAILLAIALQSITDYPLRNQSMLALASFAFLLLARIGTRRGENEHDR